MSAIFYERKATIKVFAQDVFVNKNTGSMVVENVAEKGKGYSNINPDGTPGFRIKFNVLTNTAKTMNPTSIYIYNLGPDSRARFERPHSKISLSAGYLGNEAEIFVGVVSRVRTRKEGPDYVTHIEAKDGLLAYEGSTINQSFGQPTSFTDVVGTLLDSFKGAKIGIPDINSLDLPSKTYHSGIVLSGKSIDKLDEVLSSVGYEVSMQKENLIIRVKGAPRDEEVFLLSTPTGMIGIPEVGDNGITVNSLLNPQLIAFNRLAIRSRFVNGLYQMVRVEHIGDTFQGEYKTKIETGKSQPLQIKTGSGGVVVRDPDGKSPVDL